MLCRTSTSPAVSVSSDFFVFHLGRYKWYVFSKKFIWIYLFFISGFYCFLIFSFPQLSFAVHISIHCKKVFVYTTRVYICQVFNEKGLIKLIPEFIWEYLVFCITRGFNYYNLFLQRPWQTLVLKYSHIKTLECDLLQIANGLNSRA